MLSAVFLGLRMGLALFFKPMRSAALMRLPGPSLQSSLRDEVAVPVRQFRVRADDGEVRDVELRGDLRGAPPVLGDRVEVLGRIDRGTGILRANRVQNLSTGQSVVARESRDIASARRRSCLGMVAVACFVLAALSLVLGA